MRILGDTGQEVSILAFGGGSRFMVLGEGNWQAALDNAVLGGINLFDTAPSYGDDQESEKRFGRHLSENYRDRILLSTKVESRDPAIAAAEIEQSFENLHTEVIDLLQIHGLEPTDNLDWILGENGLWELMTRLKEEGRVRFIGASVMYSPEVALRFAGQARPDVMLLAINAFSKGFTPYPDFEDSALQEIRGLGVGVLTMKAMRDLVGTGSGRLSAGQLLQYNWDLDVSTVLVGHERLSELDFNLELAGAQEIPTALDPEELAWIRRRAQGRKDLPCWLQPGYVDGQV